MSETEYTEEELLALLASDVEAAAAALLESYGGLIWRVCGRRLADTEDIKECVNSTFADFCMQWERYDPERGTLQNYLCTIGNHKAMECYRKNETRKRIQTRVAEEVYENSLCEEVNYERLEEALDQLDPIDKLIIQKKYYDGMTFSEIAQQLNLPYETVKKRNQRNLKKLLKLLLFIILAAAALTVSLGAVTFASNVL